MAFSNLLKALKNFHYIRHSYSTTFSDKFTDDKLLQSKLKLVLSEYELLKCIKPDQVPSKLFDQDLDYLLSLYKTRKYKKLTWVDISYKLRENALTNLCKIENFNGVDNLFIPMVGFENEKLQRKRQTSMIPFSQSIIFDISFDRYMSSLECKNLGEQLIRIFNINKFNERSLLNFDSYNLHVTNLESSDVTSKFMDSLFGSQIRNYYPNVFFHNQPFVDIFKKENLIYLSPHAEETMVEYDNNANYIIGGIVDRREIIELTTSKCRELGIRTLKLPLELITHKSIQSLDDVFKLLCLFKHNNKIDDNIVSKIIQKKKRNNIQ